MNLFNFLSKKLLARKVCALILKADNWIFFVMRQMDLYANELDLFFLLVNLNLSTLFVVYFLCTFQAIHY